MSKLRAFTMPKWGIEMTEGQIAEWKIAEGASFSRGDMIALIETDKITNEVEAEFDATLCRRLAREGETYPVGALLGVFATEGVDDAEVDAFINDFKGVKAGGDAPPTPNPVPVAKVETSSAGTARVPEDLRISPAARAFAESEGVDVSGIQGSGPKGRITYQDVHQAARPPASERRTGTVDITPKGTDADSYFASPLAKRLAVLHGVDLGSLEGSGPRGRISKADVMASVDHEDMASSTATLADDNVEVVRMSPMRKAIAQSLTLSKTTIPHYYLRTEVRIDRLRHMREQARAAAGEAPSINDYVVRAVAMALIECQDVNIQVHGDEIHRFRSADIAVAVATDKGLITPIVRGANNMSVAAIAAEVKRLAERARAGRLKPDEFQGGSFTISNLGMYGIDQFDAIINPPQGAILAVGAAKRKPVEADMTLSFATMMHLSLSCDHRAIDGAVGAKFMAVLRGLIENPERLTA